MLRKTFIYSCLNKKAKYRPVLIFESTSARTWVNLQMSNNFHFKILDTISLVIFCINKTVHDLKWSLLIRKEKESSGTLKSNTSEK
jgi:hypothetical protein